MHGTSLLDFQVIFIVCICIGERDLGSSWHVKLKQTFLNRFIIIESRVYEKLFH